MNITLNVDEKLIKKARKKAIQQNTSLNKLVQQWLQNYTGKSASSASERYKAMMTNLNYVQTGKKFSREELNER
ncbi:MAG: DUF6364 family protein [bacterium]